MMDNDGLSIPEVSWNMGAHKSSICRILHKTNHPAGVLMEPSQSCRNSPRRWMKTSHRNEDGEGEGRLKGAGSGVLLPADECRISPSKIGDLKMLPTFYQHFCGYKNKSPIHQHLWILPTFYLQKNWMPIRIEINQENSGDLCGWFAVDKVGRIRNQGCSQHPQGRWNRKKKDEERKVEWPIHHNPPSLYLWCPWFFLDLPINRGFHGFSSIVPSSNSESTPSFIQHPSCNRLHMPTRMGFGMVPHVKKPTCTGLAKVCYGKSPCLNIFH